MTIEVVDRQCKSVVKIMHCALESHIIGDVSVFHGLDYTVVLKQHVHYDASA